MAFGDEQITRLTGNLDAVLAKRISQIDEMCDNKIAKMEELLKRFSMTATINTTLLDITKPTPNGP